MNIFDIIGPVMIGPSSSHTAGAVKIGNAAQNIFNKKIDKAVIHLYNSFSDTGKGHGTDTALIGGLLGYRPDDENIVNSYEIAKERGVEICVVWEEGLDEKYEPNTAVIELWGEGTHTQITAASVGGGRIRATEIDGYDIRLSCEHDTLITIHKDVVGVVSKVSTIFAQYGVNIAFLALYRKIPGEEMMIVETDNPICDEIVEKVLKIDEIIKASNIKKLV